MNLMNEELTNHEFDIVATEMPLVHGKQHGSGTLLLLQFYGILVMVTYQITGYDPSLIGIPTWKKIICGNGMAEKSKVHTALKKIYPDIVKIKAMDALDSLCIAHGMAVKFYIEKVKEEYLSDYYDFKGSKKKQED